jgi:hypothetical protein
MEFIEKDARAFYKLLAHEKQTEVRAINPETKKVEVCHCNNEEEFVNACRKFNGYYNVYAGIHERIENGTKKKDVKSISLIPIDIDCVKKPASEEELAAALAKAERVKQDYNCSALIPSGNGDHLYKKIPRITITDENREDIEKKLKQFGEELLKRYSDNKVKLDTAVYDLPRIMRVPGTINLKSKTLSKIIEIDYNEDASLRKKIFDNKLRIGKPQKATLQQIKAVEDYIKIENLVDFSAMRKVGGTGEFQGPNLLFPTDSTTHLNINTEKNNYFDWKANHGGSALEFYAVGKGIIGRGERLEGEKFHKAVLSAIEEFKIEIKEKKDKKNSELVKIHKEIEESIVDEFFVDLFGVPYATIKVNNHLETWKISSSHYEDFFVKEVYEKTGNILTETQLKNLINISSAKAKFGGEKKQVYLRAANVNGIIYLDLCNDNWEALKISANEITKASAREIKFQRQPHMKELLVDLHADLSDINRIFKYVEVGDDDEKILLRSHLVLFLLDGIATCILVIHGPQGSGKTIRMRIIKELVDPSLLKVLSLGKDITQLVQQVSHHYLPFYDNVRQISKPVSDLICRLVTGEGFSKRELFTNDEDIIYSLKRKVAFDGINLVGQEPDFMDRSFTLGFERIPKNKRRTEEDLFKEFDKEKSLITGAIIKLLQKALSLINEINLTELPRMADYCKWGEAVSRAYGNKEGAFVNAYFNKIEKTNDEVIESNAVGLCIIELMDVLEKFERKSEWLGTPSELYIRLSKIAENLKLEKAWDWPKGHNALTWRLNEIATNLLERGIKVTTGIRIGTKRGIKIEKGFDNSTKIQADKNCKQGAEK